MKKIATTPDQSARVLACDVEAQSADMYLSINLCDGENFGKYSTHVLGSDCLSIGTVMKARDYSPAWSLTALIALLPAKLSNLYRLVMGPNGSSWDIEYNTPWVTESLVSISAPEPIEACVKMIEWLVANEYKLNQQC